VRNIWLAVGAVAAIMVTGVIGASAQTCPEKPLTKPSPSSRNGPGVLELIKDISIDTKWSDLPSQTRARLQVLADDRLAAYRSQWASDALSRKEVILLQCPTPQMTLAIDQYYRLMFNSFISPTFTLSDIKDKTFTDALVRAYLGVIAAGRASLAYPTGPLLNLDWDGESHFDSIRLPDNETYEAIKSYNRQVVAELMKIDDTRSGDMEKRLKQYALFVARANAEGSRADSYGSDYLEQACDIAELNYDILAGYEGDGGRPQIFKSDEDVLRETNALYLHNTQLKWLDVGTRASAFAYCATDRNRINTDIGDPHTNLVAKGIVLLNKWWGERTTNLSAQKCTIYSSQDRDRIWDAFSADQQFNNDNSTSMDTYQAQLNKYGADKTAHYRQAVREALAQIFPTNEVLTLTEREKVAAALDSRTDYGVFFDKIPQLVDSAQGTTDGPAAKSWNGAVAANMVFIGGNYTVGEPVRTSDNEQIKAMFEEVKSWVARHYQGYPIDVAALFPHIDLEVTTKSNAFTENGTAKIVIGVGTKRSKAEYYSWLLHELRHAVMFAWHATAPDKSLVKDDEGPALEGSGVAVEDILLLPFLRDSLKSDTAYVLYVLQYGIRDARFAGTTDATLKRYLRSGCADSTEPNTIEYTKIIARSYGLTDELADTVAERSHAGTQYLQYIWGGLYMLKEISYLQEQLDAGMTHRVDPYVLFACGLNTPRRDPGYINALKMCMRI
jgi:hypothetical protein